MSLTFQTNYQLSEKLKLSRTAIVLKQKFIADIFRVRVQLLLRNNISYIKQYVGTKISKHFHCYYANTTANVFWLIQNSIISN